MTDEQTTQAPAPGADSAPSEAPTANTTADALNRYHELRTALTTATDPVVKRELTSALNAVVAGLSPVEAKAPEPAKATPEPATEAELSPDDEVLAAYQRQQAAMVAKGFHPGFGLGQARYVPPTDAGPKAKAAPPANVSDVDAFDAELVARAAFGRSGGFGLGGKR